MPYYSIIDYQMDNTTSVYNIGSCDFPAMFDLLKTFAKDNKLDDCYVVIRDYEDNERRENSNTPAEETYKEKAKKNKKVRLPKIFPVDADSGTAHVVSFDWVTHKVDKAKQIDYKFYDNGWPGYIIISKRPSLFTPTEIVMKCHNTDKDLATAFHKILLETEIEPSKI